MELTAHRVLEYLRIVYARRWLAAGVFVFVVAGVGVYTATAKRVYEAQASVLIDADEPNVLSFKQVLDEGRTLGGYYETQAEVLRSRALAARTAARLKLWQRPGGGADTEASAADSVLAKLQVLPIRSSRIMNIRVRASDPALAADIANAHAAEYVQQSLETRFTASEAATTWLDVQLAKERTRVEQAESALQHYREQHDAVSLKSGQDIVVQKLADLNAALTKAKTNRIEKEVAFKALSAAERDRAGLEAFPAIMANGFIQQLKGELARLQREYAQLSDSLGPRHPTLIEKRTEIDTTQKRLVDEIGRVVQSAAEAYRTAQAEEDSLGRTLEAQKREALALNGRGIEYAALERDAESVRLVYQSLLQRAKETSVSRDLPATNIRILDSARPPAAPVLPRPRANAAIGVAGGVLFALGAVFGVEFFDERVKTPDDLRAQIGSRFLGLVPEVSTAAHARVSLLDPGVPSSFVESMRGLRTSVVSAARGRDRTVLVASASEREGKTAVAGNLAIALAQARHSVVLIDADMRRPSVHRLFGHRQEPGLSNVLAGTATLAEVMRPTPVAGLRVMSAGTISARPSETLASPLFKELLDLAQAHFTWVVIDSPPVLTVTDASVLAPQAGGIAFVVGSGMSTGRSVRLAIDELESSGGRMLGAVLNRTDIRQLLSPYLRGEYRTPAGPPPDEDVAAGPVFGRSA